MKRLPFLGTPLRPKGVVLGLVLAAAVLAPWLGEWALHGYLERTASALNGAEVSIGSFGFSLLRGRASLEKIQVTQHTEPRFNLLEIEKIEFSFIRSALLSRQLRIPEIRVTGARLRTQRERSGVLPSDLAIHPTPLVDRIRPDAAFLTPGNLKASPLRFIAALTQNRENPLVEDAVRRTSAFQQEIAAFRAHVDARSGAWANSLASLVAPEKNPTPYLIQRRLDQLQELQDSVAAETKQFQLTKQAIQSRLADKAAESLTRQGIQSGDALDLSDALFGNRFAGHVERLSYWIEASRRRIAFGPALSSLAKDPQAPGVIIDSITLLPSSSGQANSLTGTLRHFSTLPVGRVSPLEASLKAEWGKGSTASLELRVDHSGQTPLETLSLSAKNLHLSDWQIESSPDLRLAVSSNRADLTFNLKASESGMEAQGKLEAQDPRFLVSSKSKPFETFLLKALPSHSDSLRITAELENRALRIQSSLGPTLAQALRAEFGLAMKARYALAERELSAKAENALLETQTTWESVSLKVKTRAAEGTAQWRRLLNADG